MGKGMNFNAYCTRLRRGLRLVAVYGLLIVRVTAQEPPRKADAQLQSDWRTREPDIVSTKAEGGLESEAGVLDEQARHAQPLREGENLLPKASGTSTPEPGSPDE